MNTQQVIDALMFDHGYTRYEAERLIRDRDAYERAMDRYDDPEDVAAELVRQDTERHA